MAQLNMSKIGFSRRLNRSFSFHPNYPVMMVLVVFFKKKKTILDILVLSWAIESIRISHKKGSSILRLVLSISNSRGVFLLEMKWMVFDYSSKTNTHFSSSSKSSKDLIEICTDIVFFQNYIYQNSTATFPTELWCDDGRPLNSWSYAISLLLFPFVSNRFDMHNLEMCSYISTTIDLGSNELSSRFLQNVSSKIAGTIVFMYFVLCRRNTNFWQTV